VHAKLTWVEKKGTKWPSRMAHGGTNHANGPQKGSSLLKNVSLIDSPFQVQNTVRNEGMN